MDVEMMLWELLRVDWEISSGRPQRWIHRKGVKKGVSLHAWCSGGTALLPAKPCATAGWAETCPQVPYCPIVLFLWDLDMTPAKKTTILTKTCKCLMPIVPQQSRENTAKGGRLLIVNLKASNTRDNERIFRHILPAALAAVA